MKNRLLVLLCWTVLVSPLVAQKYDHTWSLGMPGWAGWYRMELSFDSSGVQIDSSGSMLYSSGTNASICDRHGVLQFMTNGSAVVDRYGDTLLNGSDLMQPGTNPGDVLFGSAIYQGALALPYPGVDSQYVLLVQERSNLSRRPNLWLSVVDMRQKRLVEKNILVATELCYGGLTATRHANGRDWWVVGQELDQNHCKRLLITPDSIVGPDRIDLGTNFIPRNASAFSHFSPDGSRLIVLKDSAKAPTEVHIYGFDRCNGQISYQQTLTFEVFASYMGGIQFSPNSQLVYACNGNKLYQWNLAAPDAQQSRTLVGTWDGVMDSVFNDPVGGSFSLMQIGPDGKIYMPAAGQTHFIHVIHQPDSPGVACNFQQRAIILPTYNVHCPNHPNYRLGPLVGSGCDTLPPVGGEPALPSRASGNLRVYPNPAPSSASGGSMVVVELPAATSGELRLLSATGAVVKTVAFNQVASLRLDLAGLPAGVYMCAVQTAEACFRARLVVAP